ncbi:DUF885 family protein [Limibacter armeniacum]|uniref:DUF885 family protein n=1 Tax=Limibacter armeniacum TaxID=466084 RepID=UPI002FE556A6
MRLNKPIIRYYLLEGKRMFSQQISKILYWSFGICLLLAVGWGINLNYFKPSSIALFFERMFFEYAIEHPELLTDTQALNFHTQFLKDNMQSDHHWYLNDLSEMQLKADSQMIQNQLEMLNGYRSFLMDEEEKRSSNTFRYITEDRLTSDLIYSNLKYPIDHINGIHIRLPLFMVNSHKIGDLSDAKGYIERLYQVQDKISALISGKALNPSPEIQQVSTAGIIHRRENESLEEALDLFHYKDGLSIPPRLVLETVEKQIDALLSTVPTRNVFYVDFSRKLKQIEKSLDEDTKSELYYQLGRAVKESVIPSFHSLKQCVQRMKDIAPDEVTIAQFSLGDMYYQHLLTRYLGTDQQTVDLVLTPDSLMRLAEKEIEIRQSSLIPLLQDVLELHDEAEFAVLWEKYQDDVQQHKEALLPSTMLNLALDTISPIYKFTQELTGEANFPLPEVRKSISVLRNTMTFAKYYPGGFFHSRAGTLYLPDSIPEETTVKATSKLWDLMYLLPGTHLQKSIQRQQKQLPHFRKVTNFLYFTEGWRYYTLEKALQYNGLQNDKALMIAIQYEFLRKAAQMACDLGIHYMLWNYEEAMTYFKEKTYAYDRTAHYSILECIALPGASTAYLPGKLILSRLEEDTRMLMGSNYNQQTFHLYLLKLGELPMVELQRASQQYITALATEQ